MPWQTISTNSEITAIHAALLPTDSNGVILYFGDWAAGDGNIGVQEVTHSRLMRMDPALDYPIEGFAAGDLPTTDAFCGGQAFLADGRLLVAGGTFGWAQAHEGIHHAHYDGERACWIYLPRTKRWVRVKDLNFQPGNNPIGGGRWYPTLVTLGNGDVFTTGGHPAADDHYPPDASLNDARHNNNSPERYIPGSNDWILMTADITAPNGFAFETDSYPRFHLMPDGLLFSDTAGKDENGNGNITKKRLFDPFAGVWTGPDIDSLETLPSFYNRGSEATSVLLPLLPPNYRPRILACNSDDLTAFYIDVDNNPKWEKTGERKGTAAERRRDNACATLLPTGQVLVTGGWPGNFPANDVTSATVVPELFTPKIDWETGTYTPLNNGESEWQTLEDQPAPNRRGYHSSALLLPDGRVWVGGSTTEAEINNRNIDIFSPDYIGVAGRPAITSCPTHIGYTMTFPVNTPQANSIGRIALIRCGSMTHGFNTDQRYVGLNFAVQNNTTLNVSAPSHGNIAPPGYYMLWLIDNQGRPCQRASFIRVSRQKLVISADISTYSIHEIEALGTPATFDDALYVVADGFLPAEVTTPTHQLLWTNNQPVPGVEVTFGPPKYEAGSGQGDVAQRIVYPVRIRFTSTNAFDAIPDNDDFRVMVFYAHMDGFVNTVTLQLSKNPNPRMRDGDPPWLSIDLRVFKTSPGNSPTAEIAHPPASDGITGAYNYIQDILDAYNSWDGANHPFDALPTDQNNNRLELGTNDENGNPVFNYALARVRFRAPEGVDAADVRVFFRMWNTGWTALEYSTNHNYRRFGDGPSAIPLLGLIGGEISNVPCFAEPRTGNMENQTDSRNRRTLYGAGSQEVFGYFGCWLDINQDVPRFPLEPSGNGPFSGDLKSIQQLMRGLHHCLVAEIHYQLDPIAPGATPGSSDNLAQRNILFDDSDNPGRFAAHLIHHTFEIKPSPVSFAQSVFLPTQGVSSVRLHPDEVVIDWGNLPRDSLVTLYVPQLDTTQIVRAGAVRQAPGNLQAVGPGMLRCRVTDVGFVPIPGPFDKNIAALLSIQLPPGVPYGKTYTIVVRQIEGRSYKVLGTTEFRIQVGKAEALLPKFLHHLALLKHIALSIPNHNRWYPVFQRYLAELGDRVRAFGGDAEAVLPSPHGTGSVPGGPERPGKRELHTFTGKVFRLLYDCFGDFEGFELHDCDVRKRFMSCDRGIEQVILTACRENLKVTVVYDNATHRPKHLALQCC